MLRRTVTGGADTVKERAASVNAEAVAFADVAVKLGKIVAGNVGNSAADRADEVVVVARAVARVAIEGCLSVTEVLLQKSAVEKVGETAVDGGEPDLRAVLTEKRGDLVGAHRAAFVFPQNTQDLVFTFLAVIAAHADLFFALFHNAFLKMKMIFNFNVNMIPRGAEKVKGNINFY